MPSLITTIEDFNPLIIYSPGWRQGNSSTDGLASNYSASAFTASPVASVSASFTFRGTSVTIFGAKRGNHGPYTVNVDGTVASLNGFSSVDIFQVPLYSQTGMQSGEHTVTITNGNGNTWLDIDFITWSNDIGQSTDKLLNTLVDDTDPQFLYQPSSAWSDNPPHLGSFSGGSGHSTASQGATVDFKFTGDAVELYGTVGPNNSPYSVQVDGGPSANFSATKDLFVPQVLLCRVDNLGSGSHTVQLQNNQASPEQVLQIDYALVFTASSGSTSVNNGVSSSGIRLSTGGLAGIAVAFAVLLVSMLGMYIFLRRKWRTRPSELETNYSKVPTVNQENTPASDTATTFTDQARHATSPSTDSRSLSGNSTVVPYPSMLTSQSSSQKGSRTLTTVNPMPSLPAGPSLSQIEQPAGDSAADEGFGVARTQAPPNYSQAMGKV